MFKQKPELYLTIGIVLSVLSKLLQWLDVSIIGNTLVLFAGCAFVLTLLSLTKWFQRLQQLNHTRLKPIALSACVFVVSFQLMLITFLAGHLLGIVFAMSFAVAGGVFLVLALPFIRGLR